MGHEDHTLNDDEECAARQMVRHVCVALKRYMESHLYYKYTQMSRLTEPPAAPPSGAQLFRVSFKMFTFSQKKKNGFSSEMHLWISGTKIHIGNDNGTIDLFTRVITGSNALGSRR